MFANGLTEEEMAYLAESAPDINTVELPPAEAFGPHAKEAARLYAELDAATDAWAEFDAEHAELLEPNWKDVARQRDKALGAEALAAGKDPLKAPSVLAEWAANRDRIMGAAGVLVRQVNAAYARLRAFTAEHRGTVRDHIRAEFEAAETAYAEAAAQMYRVRNTYGAALQRVYWVDAFSAGASVGPFPSSDSATPRGPQDSELRDLRYSDQNALPGMAEIKAVRTLVDGRYFRGLYQTVPVKGALMVDAIDTETGERVHVGEDSVRVANGRYVRL
ncbi:hypothetical protein [Actinacidiphila glaucinigra]|uniref:hypothetical protein n=1 Tax=Actinacidiphila glaucinigra TaxID=235986 RepID=UPI00382E5801